MSKRTYPVETGIPPRLLTTCDFDHFNPALPAESLTGPALVGGGLGPQGLPGAIGPKGDTGAAGPAGAIGPAGPAGVAGAQGPKGDPGVAGLTGVTGPAGVAGVKGDTGAAGPAGSTGPAGPAGSIGPAGVAGAPGIKGDTGAAGPAGSTGPIGPTGGAGPAGVAGATGPIGPAGGTGATGAVGAPGVKGDTGAQGPIGLPGPDIAGSAHAAIDYISPLTPPRVFASPSLFPWNLSHTVTHGRNYSDQIGTLTVSTWFQGGGGNFSGPEIGLGNSILGINPNVLGLVNTTTANTDVQVGGAFQNTVSCYGVGDCVLATSYLFGNGGSRGINEHNRKREFLEMHGDNWGIVISFLSTDAMGQSVMTALHDTDGTPHPSSNHSLQASADDLPILNMNPAKAYTLGSAQTVERCPAGLAPLLPTACMCVVGDITTNWDTHFGTSSITTLTAQIGDHDGGTTITPFVSGPVCVDAAVGETSGLPSARSSPSAPRR